MKIFPLYSFTKLSNAIFFLIFVLGFNFSAGAYVYDIGTGMHKIHVEFFQTRTQAAQACDSLASSLGYSPWCGGSSTINGGWWRDSDSVFHYADFRYNSEIRPCPDNGPANTQVGNPVDCLSGAKIQEDRVFPQQVLIL